MTPVKMPKKRVLVISYYWPPSAGSGVQRWLKFAKFLPEFGWEPVIYTPENPDFNVKDESLLNDVSPELEVIKRPIFEVYKYYNRLTGGKKGINAGVVKHKEKISKKQQFVRWIRGNFFIPDPRVFWVRPSVSYLEKYLKENPVDVIVTTSPPHSLHLIGKGLREKLGIPWMMDIRDPWSKLDFLDTFLLSDRSRKKQEQYEQECLNKCDHVIATSSSMPDLLMPFPAEKFTAITNGFDEEDFPENENIRPEKFRIFHAGLLNELRDPIHLWESLSELCQEHAEFEAALEIKLAGMIDPAVIEGVAAFDGLAEKLKVESYLSHKEVLRQYKSAAVLLLLVNNSDNARVNIPGKLFELMASHRPILGLGDIDCDAAKIVADSQTGSFSHYADKEGIKERVLSLFQEYQKGEHMKSERIERYSRRALSRDLAALLDTLRATKNLVH